MFPRCLKLVTVRRGLNFTSVRCAANNSPSSTTKLSKEQMKKKELRALLQKRAAAKKSPFEHPLYMPVQQAFRFLRAAEVGQPPSQQTISLTTVVVSDKGAPLLSGNILFPNPLRDVKVAVFTNNKEQEEVAREQFKCHLVGGTELIEAIKNGDTPIDFDKALATPDVVAQLTSQLASVLGPRRLLPAVKKGTVSENIANLIRENMFTVPFRQRGPFLSVAVGKCDFSDKQLLQNIVAVQKAFKQALADQQGKKSSILGKTTVTSTHGPGIVIDFR
ncbi:mitochondrial 54S ribosomal protein uL1m Ecym_4302 [Eremothecium cymbalariae DBVPG|uniref:Ribosomal protein n=1 Tax=Eremothecium cymbalariae (strain CBS 270.75 / DBVPG 7215 / KCTC 17166 / NRRL Y-17582) TaxID=931890 RepID=G8JTL2_ERECY|nr:hypothetical protein Ecym_4302 [Eremothecium cymbalariae DBVPG\